MIGHPLVEQVDERADDAGLGLAPLPQEDDVVPGQEGVLQLRHHGGLVAQDPVEQGLAGGDLGDGVAADLLLHGERLPAGLAELTEGGGARGHEGTLPPPSRGTSLGPARRPEPPPRPIGPADRGLRRPTLPSGMDLSGTWRAAPADDDLRREAVQPEYDDDAWERVAGPRSLAVGAGVLDERRPAHLPHPLRPRARPGRGSALAGPRRALLPGRRVARRCLPRRPRGLLRPPRLRHHRPGRPVVRALAVHRGHVQPAARPGRQAQHHRRLPALGLHRRRLEPRRPVAPRPGGAHRAGAHLQAAGRVPRGPRRPGGAAAARRARLGRHPLGAAAHHRRRPGGAGLRPRPRAGRQRGHLAVRRRQPHAVVAVVARRAAPHPPHGGGASPTTCSATPRGCGPACARSGSTTGPSPSTASGCS